MPDTRRQSLLHGRLVSACIIGLALVAVPMIAWLWAARSAYWKDDRLRRLFAERREDFEGLRDMLLEDESLGIVGADVVSGRWKRDAGNAELSFWRDGDSWVTNALSWKRGPVKLEVVLNELKTSRERYQQYVEILSRIGADRIERQGRGRPWEAIAVCICRRGIAPSSAVKSIIYFPNGIYDGAAVLEDTELTPDESECYSPITGDWYIQHVRS